MIKSRMKYFIFVIICFLFIVTPGRYAFAGEGSHAGTGRIISEPVNEPGNKSVTRQIIREDEIRNENNMGEDIPYDDNSIIEENNDPIDNAEINDPIDKAEKNDPIDREDNE
jgi:hypothetical protein